MVFTLTIVSLAANIVLLLWLFILTLKVRGYKKSYQRAAEGLNKGKLPEMLEKNTEAITGLGSKIDDLYSLNGKLNKKIEDSYRNIGLVRFNAFSDTGGDQSFSLALLDDKKNGIVITALSGREESRIFVKDVKEGAGTPELSEEEENAISAAVEETR